MNFMKNDLILAYFCIVIPYITWNNSEVWETAISQQINIFQFRKKECIRYMS